MANPVLDWVDGFEHGTDDTLQFESPAIGVGIWDLSPLPANISFPAGRNGLCLRVVEPGDAVNAAYVTKYLPGSQHRTVQVRVRMSAAPGENSNIMSIFDAVGGVMGNVRCSTGGLIGARAGNGTFQNGPSITDSAWHRLDFHLDTSGTTWTMNWYVDGSLQTAATQGAHVATDSIRLSFGSATTTNNATVEFDDATAAVAATVFPMPPMSVIGSLPNVDGTHVNTTNAIEDQTGLDLSGTYTTAHDLLDEWPVNTTDYIQQTTGSATGYYAEVGFQNIATDLTVVGVIALSALFASSGTAETGTPTTRIVDSGGATLVNVYSGDQSEVTVNYRTAIVPAPGGTWSATDYNALKARVGFRSNSVGGVPRWTALMLQVATIDSVTTTKTHTATAIVSIRGTKTHTSDARISSAVSTKTHTTTAIILKAASKFHQTDAYITGGGARVANSAEGGANGATVTAGNSGGASGNAFQDVATGAGTATVQYDSSTAGHGNVSIRIDPALAATYVGYTTSIGTQTIIYGRAYYRPAVALPAQGIRLATVFDAGTLVCGSVGILTTGRLTIADSAGVTQATTPNDPTGKVVVGSWARIEWRFFGDPTTGSIELKLFLTPASTTPDSTITATNINTRSAFAKYRVGMNNSTAVDESVFNIDEIVWDTAGYPGPASDLGTRSHTSSAIIKASPIRTQTATAIVRKQSTLTHTSDARLLLQPHPFHTSDAVIKKTLTVAHTSDAYLNKPNTKFHGSDALIAGGFTPPANAWVVVDVTSTLAVGTVPIPTVTDTLGSTFTNEGTVHGVSSSVRLSRFYTFTGPNPLPRSVLVSFGGQVQARVLVEVMTIQGVDRSDPFVTTFPASFVGTGAAITYDVNPYLNSANRGLFAATHLADEVSNPEAGWTELNDLHGATVAMADAWSDAEDDSPSYTWASTVGGLLGMFSEIQVLHTGASLHQSDAIISHALIKTHTTTAILRATFTKTHTTTAIIVGTRRSVTHSTDAFLIAAGVRIHTTTAVITKTLTRSHTSDAYILSADPVVPVPITPYTTYRMALAERSGSGMGQELLPDVFGVIGFLRSAPTLMYEEELNGPGRLEFSLPIDEPFVTRSAFAPRQREIYLYRGDTEELVWGGTLEIAEVRDWEVRFVALGFYDGLARRTVKQDYDSRLVFQGPQLGWTHLDQFDIVRELVNLAQAEDGMGLTFQDPAALTGVTRKLTICAEERRLVSDVIEEFAAATNGFDFAVTPDKQLQLWFPRRASGSATIIVDGTQSFSDVAYTIDASEVITQVSGIGPPQDCEVPDIIMQTDTAAVSLYGVLDGTVDLQHNWDDEHRAAIVTEALTQGNHPRFQTKVTVPTQLPNAPDPSSYAVGDTIVVTATRGTPAGFGYFTLQARILSRRVTVTPPGIETVELTIDVENLT